MTTTLDKQFKLAADTIVNLPPAEEEGEGFQPSRDDMAVFYKYFKQATKGDAPKEFKDPSWVGMISSAYSIDHIKWTAWDSVRGMPKEDAQKNYVEFLVKMLRQTGDAAYVAKADEIENLK